MTDAAVPGLAARRAALRLLDAVLRRGLPLDAAKAAAVRDLPDRQDQALAQAIAAEVLRRLPDLDALIDSATRNRLADDAKARMVLRIALVQPLMLGTPPHAAIATVLPLVDGGPRKLVHGVFGTLMRKEVALPELPLLPEAVAVRWASAWGDDVVEAARVAIAQQPPLDLSLANDEAVAPDGISLAPRHRRLASGSVTALPGFEEGGWWVQDLAASIPARLLGQGGERSILDLCAAPGGKAMQLAAAGWRVQAVDGSAARLKRLRENLTRTGLSAELIEADIMRWMPKAPVAAVLLDAPCSATGVFRRHPDVLHRVRPKAIADLALAQAAMLARAADWVSPDGLLVYATCSLEPEEGEAQMRSFLAARPDFTLVPPSADELPAGIPVSPEGWVRTLPGMIADQGGLDGFFVARLRRRPLAGAESGH